MISVLQILNCAQFLNATCIIAPSAISAASAAFLLLRAIFPVTRIYALEQLQKLDFVKTLLDRDVNNYPLIHCLSHTIFLLQISKIHFQNCLTDLKYFAFPFLFDVHRTL